MDENELAIVDWVNSFQIPVPCTSLHDLCDGVLISAMLAEIAPTYFDKSIIVENSPDNWALCAGNFKQILRMLDEYYSNVLKKNIDVSSIDVNAIVREHDHEELFNLLELVVGCAVLSDNKADFIKNIFSLDPISQTVLKGMVERVMTRTMYDVQDDDDEAGDYKEVEFQTDGDGDEGATGEELLRAQEMVRHLQEERQRLVGTVNNFEKENASLQYQLDTLRAQVARIEEDKDVSEGSERSRAAAVASASAALQSELASVKKELDQKSSENDSLRSDLRVVTDRLNATREIQAKLEIDAQQMADELDIARDKANKLTKAEATIEKYQRRLEDFNELKKQNQELESKMDVYLDRIAELESVTKNIQTLNRLIDQYKDRGVELESAKFEAQSALQMKEEEVKRLSMELEESVEARNFLQDELSTLRTEVETQRDQNRDGEGKGLGMFESVSSLKETIRQQDAALRAARAEGQNSADTTFLQAQLDDANRIRKEREDMLFAAKKQLVEAQQEAQKYAKALHEAVEGGSAGGPANSANITKEQLKELEQQLGVKTNTLKLLEGSNREKETTINKLEQEKMKLENYAKRTLSTFKEKYMAALQQMKAEKKALEDRVYHLQAKAEKDLDTHLRQERLLLSAMYELGVKMMDRNIQMEIRDTSSNPATFLSSQRAEQDRASGGGMASSGAAAGHKGSLHPPSSSAGGTGGGTPGTPMRS